MKTIKLGLMLLIALFFLHNVQAALPLVEGDVVVTHSPITLVPNGSPIVVRQIATSNTSTALMNGHPWITLGSPGSIPTSLNQTKPLNWTAPNKWWEAGTLGAVFGITLDSAIRPNIYVSNTQIYSGSNLNAGKVWRLDGTSGLPTTIHNFPNTNRSLGNLKYLKIGTKEIIYVSNWDNGLIEVLRKAVSIWLPDPGFKPKFGLQVANPNFLPYGIAVRNVSGTYRLYYSKISVSPPYSASNEIWSVELDATTGNIINTSERKETIPITALYPSQNSVIADIAFTEDGQKMLVGQQGWDSFGSITTYSSAHKANVAEFKISSTPTIWIASGNAYPAGTYSVNSNATGGVSYSNKILQQNTLGADSTVWFGSDAETYTSTVIPTPLVAYGIIGMRIRNNNVNDAIFIDSDDYFIDATNDKTRQGDVEAYKKPMLCPPCGCGTWTSLPTRNGALISGVTVKDDPIKVDNPSTKAKAVGPPIVVFPSHIEYPITFAQGTVSGLLNASYQCKGECGPTYNWNITNASGATVSSGATLPIDLKKNASHLKCGLNKLVINASCGGKSCAGLIIPITIKCITR